MQLGGALPGTVVTEVVNIHTIDDMGDATFASDFVEARADKDVLVVMSNCPQFYNPCSGWNPTPIRIIVWQPS